MMKLKLLLFLLVGMISTLNAFELDNSSLYVKLGAERLATDSETLPKFGLGARFQRNRYGLDLSVNLEYTIFNYYSIKGMFLFYPYPEKKNQLYFGIGPEIGYQFKAVPLNHSSKGGRLSLEGVLGYEFRHSDHFKTFIQLELTQPILHFGGGHQHGSLEPGIALTAGIGF